MTHPLWPLFDLHLVTNDLVLRSPTDDDLPGLFTVAKAGIHDPAEMPFGVAWTDQKSPDFERSFAQHYWGMRANWDPNHWSINFGVFRRDDGQPLGAQSIGASQVLGATYAAARAVNTGSWLGQQFQGKGYGKQMRQAVLHFAFEHLRAEVAYSEANVDNPSSIGVSRAVGYEDNGRGRNAPRGRAVDTIRFRLDRERWLTLERIPVEVRGFADCRDMFVLPED